MIPGNLPNPSLEHTVCINEERVQKWKKKKKKHINNPLTKPEKAAFKGVWPMSQSNFAAVKIAVR